jgi:hypothetical protein
MALSLARRAVAVSVRSLAHSRIAAAVAAPLAARASAALVSTTATAPATAGAGGVSNVSCEFGGASPAHGPHGRSHAPHPACVHRCSPNGTAEVTETGPRGARRITHAIARRTARAGATVQGRRAAPPWRLRRRRVGHAPAYASPSRGAPCARLRCLHGRHGHTRVARTAASLRSVWSGSHLFHRTSRRSSHRPRRRASTVAATSPRCHAPTALPIACGLAAPASQPLRQVALDPRSAANRTATCTASSSRQLLFTPPCEDCWRGAPRCDRGCRPDPPQRPQHGCLRHRLRSQSRPCRLTHCCNGSEARPASVTAPPLPPTDRAPRPSLPSASPPLRRACQSHRFR